MNVGNSSSSTKFGILFEIIDVERQGFLYREY